MMKASRPITQRSQSQLEAHIRSLAQNSANLVFTDHIRAQMRTRRISMSCVLSTLREGRIRRTPEPNAAYGTLECRMEARCEGSNVGVVVALNDVDPTLVLVTALYI